MGIDDLFFRNHEDKQSVLRGPLSRILCITASEHPRFSPGGRRGGFPRSQHFPVAIDRGRMDNQFASHTAEC